MIEQDYRFIKKRTRITLGFKSFNVATNYNRNRNLTHDKKGQLKKQ